MRKHKHHIEGKIEQEIRFLLLENAKKLTDIIDSISVGSDDVKVKVLRHLIDDSKVGVDGDLYTWIRN